jgi:hypothetical protein
MILDPGARVRVISARGNSVIVRQIDPTAPEANAAASTDQHPQPDQPLDFDLT